MKKSALVLLLFVAFYGRSAGIVAIHDESDIKRVRNNVNQFWQKHTDLIEPLKNKEPLSQAQLHSIEGDKTCVVRDYKFSKPTFKKRIKRNNLLCRQSF